MGSRPYFVVGRTPASAPDPLVRLLQHTQNGGRRRHRPRPGPPHFATSSINFGDRRLGALVRQPAAGCVGPSWIDRYAPFFHAGNLAVLVHHEGRTVRYAERRDQG